MEKLRLRLILPFPLPTHNQLNALGLRDRMYVKRFIRDTASMSIASAGGSRIPMGFPLRPSLTGWSVEVYLGTIRRTGYQKRRARLKSDRTSKRRSLKYGR